jgi:hypothetical protein
MAFSAEYEFASAAVPGSKITLRRMGFARRTEVDFKALKLRQRMREIEQEYPPQNDREKEISRQLQAAMKKLEYTPEADKLAVYSADVAPLEEEFRNVPISVEIRKTRAAFDQEYALVDSQIRLIWIREGFVKIEGGEADGMTVDQILDSAPQALSFEIYAALLSDGRLTGEESKNSQSHSTSDAPAGGTSESTSAPGASNGTTETAIPSTQAA